VVVGSGCAGGGRVYVGGASRSVGGFRIAAVRPRQTRKGSVDTTFNSTRGSSDGGRSGDPSGGSRREFPADWGEVYVGGSFQKIGNSRSPLPGARFEVRRGGRQRLVARPRRPTPTSMRWRVMMQVGNGPAPPVRGCRRGGTRSWDAAGIRAEAGAVWGPPEPRTAAQPIAGKRHA